MFKRIHTKVGLLFCASLLSACNAVSGVDDLQVESTDGGPRAVIQPLITIPGITIKEIALNQAVKAQLMMDGMPVASKVPIIAGKPGLLRVYVETDASYTGEPVTARLFIDGNPMPFDTMPMSLPTASKEEDLATTINFSVPGEWITATTNYKVLIGKPSGPIPLPSTQVLYPAAGWAPMPTKSVVTTAGPGFKFVLVPVQYGADGSNRTLDTNPDVLKAYADGFRAMYPINDILLTVHDPFPWSQQLSAGGGGWSEMLDAITSLRATDNVPDDVYYFGVFQPADTFSQYCGGGCVLGLAHLAQSAGDRAAIGVSFFEGQSFNGQTNAETSVDTALHEVGHCHGRQHSPSCGAAGPDPGYPYPGGHNGTLWGYNIVSGKVYDPNVLYDIMGYCTPFWISDYTYNKLFDRVTSVNMARTVIPETLRNLTYDRILINAFGEMKWMPPLKMGAPPQGEERTVVLESTLGEETIKAQFIGFDHLPGGRLIWPSTAKPAQAIRFDYQGKVHRVLAPHRTP